MKCTVGIVVVLLERECDSRWRRRNAELTETGPRRMCWRWWQEAAGVCLDMLRG